MRWAKFALSLIVTTILLIGWLVPFGPLPISLNRLVSPQLGFWQNAESTGKTESFDLSFEKLKNPVKVVVEDRQVPHVFAENDHDLYFMQGYLTAKDRLWEMDFMVRATGGYLAEILGVGPDSAILRNDQRMRRKGLQYAAERNLEVSMGNDTTRNVLEAFAAGVNAYISSLQPAEYPIEFKLMDYEPSEWTPLKTYLLYGALAEDLTGGSNDMAYTRELLEWGRTTFDQLHPEYPYAQTPIIPDEVRWPRLRRLPVPPTALPEDAYYPDSLMAESTADGAPMPADEVVEGSNNWAVAPDRSQTGAALLADDPHLGLNLPSIWHEIQLSAPGVNVYGVTVPGIPGVIIGFNDSISWGLTNAAFDVLDHYRIFYTDEDRRYYLHDGQERPVALRIEEIKVKDDSTLFDTVRYTHHGPVMYDREFGDYEFPVAIRWTHYEATDIASVMYRINRSDSAQQFLTILQDFVCPSQNFVFADVKGQIGLVQAGRIPNRWPEQGRFLLDGRLRSHDWQGFVPFEMMPQVLNPTQGYVGSANQHPTAEGAYPYYYTANYEDYRGRRLYQLLSASDTTPLGFDDFQRFQLDSYGLFAADILPLMLSELDSTQVVGKSHEVYEVLQGWDYQYEREAEGAALFEAWWEELYSLIWSDEYLASGQNMRYPDRSTTIGILADSAEFRFYDVVGDTAAYDRRRIIQESFAQMVENLLAQYPDPADWQWQTRKQTDIRHLGRLAPFSALDIPTDGSRSILNATTNRTGPSWRMMVSMEKPIRARGVYPGGQSGNPGSPHYDEFIPSWQNGVYFELQFMNSASASISTLDYTISAQPSTSTTSR